ncbi:unnamed protein product [Effrenium voratum]|uniref:Uncharacterized protein n=1 Tax=Effrenium voratum TaxID=2562239 RepID=A0AA36JI77_9DINO|nr:unnamed protein product [Effrenium voratum]
MTRCLDGHALCKQSCAFGFEYFSRFAHIQRHGACFLSISRHGCCPRPCRCLCGAFSTASGAPVSGARDPHPFRRADRDDRDAGNLGCGIRDLGGLWQDPTQSTAAKDIAVPAPFQPSKQFGATEPLGFFDPLGFTAVGDERGFRKLRVSEIKHGRVAMMASIGLVGQHFLKFPGFEQSPAGFSVMGRGEGVLGFFGIFLLCALLELAWREEPGSDREPGNYGDPFGVNMYNDEMRMKELNNGRMAMISVLGIFAAEMATGKDAMQQFGLPALGAGLASSASASRSSFAGSSSSRVAAQQNILRRAEAVVEDVLPPFQPSKQFGATEPLGFFDPLGFTAVGDERGFRKLRVSAQFESPGLKTGISILLHTLRDLFL